MDQQHMFCLWFVPHPSGCFFSCVDACMCDALGSQGRKKRCPVRVCGMCIEMLMIYKAYRYIKKSKFSHRYVCEGEGSCQPLSGVHALSLSHKKIYIYTDAL